MLQDLLFLFRSRPPQLLLAATIVSAIVLFPGDPCDCCSYYRYGTPYKASEAYRNIPLSFEKNEGQAPAEYAFIAHGAAYEALFSAEGVGIVPRNADGGIGRQVRLHFEGSSASPLIEGDDLLPGRANYYIGSDAAKWQTDVPSFGRVRYRAVYPGVDVVYYGRRRQLENDLVVAPGADPSTIRMVVRGGDSVVVDSAGDLVVRAAGEEFRWKKPAIYQQDGDVKSWVDGSFVMGAGHTVGFRVSHYDRTRPLVIDPVLDYATYYGRSQDESGAKIVLDPAGNMVVCGPTTSLNFPVNGGIDPPVLRSGTDAFVMKVSADGSTVLFSAVFGGSYRSIATGLGLDAAGNIYVGGATLADDFPVTAGALQPKFGGAGALGRSVGDGFLLKLAPQGNRVIYSTYFGGNDSDGITSIAVDSQGNVYATGGTTSTNFPVSGSAYQTFYRGSSNHGSIKAGDAFVARINAQGTALVYSTLIGGSGDDLATTIAIDTSGIAYIGGFTNSPNFPTVAAFQGQYRGSGGQENSYFGDGFLAAVKADGTGLVYSSYLGGRNDDGVTTLAVDAAGNVYATGATLSTDFPVTGGAAQATFRGTGANIIFHSGDGFMVKVNRSGSLVYSTYLGGKGDDGGVGIAVDGNSNVYVTGFTNSTDFPLTSAVQSQFQGGGRQPLMTTGDAFITEFDATGAIVFSSFLGGSGDDFGMAVAVDSVGNIYLAGNTVSADFPVTANALQRGFGGSGGTGIFPEGDLFLAKLGTTSKIGVAALQNAASYGGPPVAPGEAVTVYGFGMGPDGLVGLALDASGRVATTLSGARLLFDGTPAPLIYVSAKQSSAFVPYSVAGKTSTQLVAEYNGLRSSAFTVAVAPSAPGFFSADASGKGPGAIQNQDGSINTPANPADRGSIITLYGTGEGQTVPPGVDGQVANTIFPKPVLPVLVSIGGVSTFDVPYIGAAPAASAGVFQVNVRIPAGAPTGNLAVVVSVGGVASQAGLTVAVR